jgi:hypothetical protein
MMPRFAWIGVFGVLLPLAACMSGPTRVSAASSEPTLFVHNVQGPGDDAGIRGRLRCLDDADCFVLESPPGTEPVARSVAVWPPGTRIWRQRGQVAGVDTPVIGAIPLGSLITGGGGSASPDTSELELPEVAPSCLTGGGEFTMLHRITEVHRP